MQTRRLGPYLLLLPGLIALGCGDSESKKRDAGDGGRIDAVDTARADVMGGDRDVPADRAADVPVFSDAADSPMGSDARQDSLVPDGGAIDGVGRADGARDALPTRQDTGADDAIRIDGGAAERPTRDAPIADTPIVLDGAGIDTPPANVFVAALSGAEVVPAVNSPATGQARFELSATGTLLTYQVTHDLADGTEAAIFLGAAGEEGPQQLELTPFGTQITGALTLTANQAASLVSGMLYLEIRSTSYPNGALRGQILRPGETLWVAHLTGAQETPPVTTSATGHATFVLGAGQDNLRYHLVTDGIDPTAVRIHTGIAAMAGGPVAYALTPVAATMDGVLVLGAADLQNLADRHWYLKVAAADNPNGELRGQVLLPGETLYSASLEGGNEVPPVATTATGAVQLVLAPNGTSLMYEAVYVGLVATQSHIHVGAAGVSGPVLYPLTLTGTGTGAKGTLSIQAADVTNMNTGGYYVNAHTAVNPGGEIRGQIVKP